MVDVPGISVPQQRDKAVAVNACDELSLVQAFCEKLIDTAKDFVAEIEAVESVYIFKIIDVKSKEAVVDISWLSKHFLHI